MGKPFLEVKCSKVPPSMPAKWTSRRCSWRINRKIMQNPMSWSKVASWFCSNEKIKLSRLGKCQDLLRHSLQKFVEKSINETFITLKNLETKMSLPQESLCNGKGRLSMGGADIEAQLTDHTMVRRRSALRHKLGMHEIVQLLIQAEKNALFSCSWSRNHCLQLQENQEKTSGFNRNYLEHLGGSRTWQETQNEHALDAKYLWNSPKVAFFN